MAAKQRESEDGKRRGHVRGEGHFYHPRVQMDKMPTGEDGMQFLEGAE